MRLLSLSLLCFASALVASDVTTYRGIDGSGTYDESGLLRTWPEGGPKKLWSAPTAHGWANAAVVGDKVYVIGGQNALLNTFALEDGRLLDQIMMGSAVWKRWAGSRTVPIISNGMAVGGLPNGQFIGIDLSTKQTKWEVNAWKSFGSGKGKMGWGWTESPAINGNLAIFNTCSKDIETPPLVAVDIRTGKTAWQMVQTPGTASNPWIRHSACDVSGVVFSHRGRPIVVHPTLKFLTALDANTGAILWEIPTAASTLPPMYIRERGWLLANMSTDPTGKNPALALTLLELSPDGSSYKVLWRRPGASKDWTFAAVCGNRIYSHGSANGSVLDADGKVLIAEGQGGSTSAAGSALQSLLCLDLVTGKLLNSLAANLDSGGHIITAEGMVYAQDHFVATPSDTPKTDKPTGKKETAGAASLRIRLIQPTVTGMQVVGTLLVPLLTKEDMGGSNGADVSWYAAIAPVISHGRLFVRFGAFHVFDLRAEHVFQGTRGDGGGVISGASAAIPASRIVNLRWTAEAAGGEVIANSTAAFHLDPSGALSACDTATGKELWRTKSLGSAGAGTGLIIRDDTGFALAAGRLRQFSLKDGAERWNVASDGLYAPITIHDLVLVQGKNALTAFAVSDGKQSWKNAGTGAAPVKLRCEGTPLIGTSDGRLLTLDGSVVLAGMPVATTHLGLGTKRYTAGEGKISCTEILSSEGKLSAKPVWAINVTGLTGQATVFDGRLYICVGNNLKVLDAATGAERSSLPLTAAPAATPLIAAGHLWLPGAGGAEKSLVVTLGDTPKIVWEYTTQGEIAAPVFITGGYALRAGGRIHALLGPTPTEPSPLTVITTPKVERPSDLKPFVNDTMPTDWLFAGPIPKKDPDLDHLAAIGGRQKIAIVKDLSFEVDGEKFTFRPIAATVATPVKYAGDRPVVELTITHSRKWNTTGYYFVTIDNDQERFVRYATLVPGNRPWIARLDLRSYLDGVPINETQPIRLGVGRHTLLVVAGMGQAEDWGKIFMLPRFIDNTQEITAILEKDKRLEADWKQYQGEELGKPFVLPTANVPAPKN